MRTEMTSDAMTAASPSRTAAPAEVSSPRVKGSARSATPPPASDSMMRMPSCTRACALFQVVSGAAAIALVPELVARTLSSTVPTAA